MDHMDVIRLIVVVLSTVAWLPHLLDYSINFIVKPNIKEEQEIMS